MHDLERRLMLKIDFMFGLALYTKLIKENGLDKQEAAKKVRKTHPLFGDPDDITHGTGDNRPLPYELKDRINIYIQERNSIERNRSRGNIAFYLSPSVNK